MIKKGDLKTDPYKIISGGKLVCKLEHFKCIAQMIILNT